MNAPGPPHSSVVSLEAWRADYERASGRNGAGLRFGLWALGVDVRGPAKAVLLSLAIRADDNGQCFPSLPTLARDCGLGTATVKRGLAALESLGVVAVERGRRTGTGRRREVNRYTLRADPI